GVELFHRNGAALATGLALPGLGAASVIPVPSTLPGPQCHCPTACGAKADAGKEGRPADNSWRVHCGAARLEQRLDDLELGDVDDRRYNHLDHLDLRFVLARFPKFGVEAVAADIRRARQYLVHGIDAPASAVACPDARRVQMLGNRFDAHRSGGAVSL